VAKKSPKKMTTKPKANAFARGDVLNYLDRHGGASVQCVDTTELAAGELPSYRVQFKNGQERDTVHARLQKPATKPKAKTSKSSKNPSLKKPVVKITGVDAMTVAATAAKMHAVAMDDAAQKAEARLVAAKHAGLKAANALACAKIAAKAALDIAQLAAGKEVVAKLAITKTEGATLEADAAARIASDVSKRALVEAALAETRMKQAINNGKRQKST